MGSSDPSRSRPEDDAPSEASGSPTGPADPAPAPEAEMFDRLRGVGPAADPGVTASFRPSGSAADPGRAGDAAGVGAGVGAGTGAWVSDLDDCARDLVESGLIDAAEVAMFRERIAARPGPADARALARELVRAGRLTPYQAGAVLQGKTRGLVIGNYVVLDKLGAGGMGMVYRARHRRLKREVALKLLPPSAARDLSAVLRFQREAKAAAKLSHPNVVAVLDADEFRGLHFLVMEYVEGRDLARLVRERGPLPIPQAIDCIVQAARGLKATFDASVVHRDIKPSNLLLEPGGTLKILDMGLARLDDPAGLLGAAPDAALTQSNVLMGTVDYMSPEQAINPRLADHRSDIYSLGCTLYFLLTGRPPFTAETLVGRLIAHREHPIPSLSAVRSDAPGVLDDVLGRMLAKSPVERLSSWDELIAALEACRNDVPSSQGPGAEPSPAREETSERPGPSSDPRLRRFARVAGVAVAVVGLVGTGIYIGRSHPRRDPPQNDRITLAPSPESATRRSPNPPAPPPATEAVPPELPASTPAAGTEEAKVNEAIVAAKSGVALPDGPVGLVREFKGHRGRVNGVAASEDGLRALSGGQDRTVRLWEAATGANPRSVEHDGPVAAVAMTPDGRLGLSGSVDRAVSLWDLRSDHDLGLRRLDGHTGPVFAVAFTRDGRRALSGGADRTVRLWDVAAGTSDGPPLVHDSPVVALATSTGDAGLAGCDDGTLWLWDLGSRQMVRRLRGPGPVLCVAVAPNGRRALSGHADGVLIAWDLDHGTEVGRMVGHGDLVRCAAYLPDGQRALAGSQAGSLLLWDVEAGHVLHRFPRPAGQLGIAVLSDGLHALTADTDATVRLWRLPAAVEATQAVGGPAATP